MALTVTFDEYNGISETVSAGIAAIVLSPRDAPDVEPMDNAVVAGDNSMVKYIKATFANMVAEGVTTISLAKIHKSAGVLKAGETLSFHGLGPVSYVTPNTSTTETASDVAIPTSLPGTQNLALGGADGGTLVADGSSDYMRIQRKTTTSTPSGAFDAHVVTLTYDVA